MNALDHAQGTQEWFEARMGCVTASRIGDALAVLVRKEGEAAARRNYRLEIICDMLTGVTSNHYVSYWMEQGKENEPLARVAYEIEHDLTVEQVGFVLHPTIARAGASPDGLVGNYGLVELKCPKTSTHLEYILAGVVPKDYKPQMYWQMACCERQWCDFVSYDPLLPEKCRLFIVRLERDEKIIAEMEQGVQKFLAEVDEAWERLQEHFGGESLTEKQLKASIAQVKARKGPKAGPQLVVDALGITPEDEMAFIRGE